MRQFSLLLSFFCLLRIAQAQQVIDSVSMGPGYENMIWYSLQNGIQATSPKNDWDIAFQTGGMSSGIRTQFGAGVKLWVYPHADTSGWNAVDTTGMSTWAELANSDISWSVGAFNASAYPNDPFDLGWGKYSMVTHQVVGDSLFVIRLRDQSFRKMHIMRLASGTFTYRAAELNGAGDTTYTLSKSQYASKRFIYQNLQSGSVLSKEPDTAAWDLVFTQYAAFLPQPFNVMGLLQNSRVEAVKVHPVDTSYLQWSAHTFSDHINTIGYDWKRFSAGQWSLEDSTVYFVKDIEGAVWKMVFTGFGGSATGTTHFTKQRMVQAPSALAQEAASMQLQVYPNPTQGKVFVAGIESNPDVTAFRVLDLQGREWGIQAHYTGAGIYTINLNHIPDGVYVLLYPNALPTRLIIKN
jgi:hypothetical protein